MKTTIELLIDCLELIHRELYVYVVCNALLFGEAIERICNWLGQVDCQTIPIGYADKLTDIREDYLRARSTKRDMERRNTNETTKS